MINTIIKGSFAVKVIRNGVTIKSIPRENNLITRGGMDALALLGNYLHVGTGGTAPVFADTSLENFLASSGASGWTQNTSILSGTDYLKESQNEYTFSIGAVVGNIAELGVSETTSEASDIQTRALFKDGGGLPTTIAVTAQDQLVVTYFVQKTISMVPFVSSISATLDGVPTTIDYTVRPCISSTSDTGSSASYQASIYQAGSGVNLFMYANSTNTISVAPVTYIPTVIDSGGEISAEGSSAVALTAAGNEVTHTMTMPITKANFQWESIALSPQAGIAASIVLFQIEFDGPNYINKTASDAVTFKLKETMNQVII